MMTQRLFEGIQHKLLMKLLEFDYSIKYKKGKENRAADALSRQDHNISANSIVQPAWIAKIEQSYVGDITYTNLLQQVSVNLEATQHYSVHSCIIRYKDKICISTSTNLKAKILSAIHSSAIGGHSGIRATYHRVKRLLHWPQLKKSVEEFVSQCAICQRAKTKHCHYPGLLAPLPIPTIAWTFISMDFIEGLPKSGSNSVILVVVDRLTKYAHFIGLSHPYTTHSMAKSIHG
jgi:hypothetical protein